MNYLLFGGQPNAGKTSTVTRLTNTLLAVPFSFRVIDGTFPPLRGNDFLILLERKINKNQSQYIIVNSPSDDALTINILRDFITKHSDKTIDVIISSVRDIGWERNHFFTTLKISSTDINVFEIPLARVTRRKKSGHFTPALNWYEATLDRHINFIITNPPFNL
ncbi:MAG: hypothetical protein JST62_03125 [Bacteroidetes bacterium]|nr:hypothetical protein [Bacteroidota bacterium]